MSDKIKYGRYKICVAKKTSHYKKVNILKTGVLKAAFMKKYLWDTGSTIRIYFMNKPLGIERKQYSEISNKDIDPLQKEVDKMDIIDAIKKIINERYAKFLNLKFKFVDNIEESDIRIKFNTDEGCWSYIGTDCLNKRYKNESTMNFGWFDVQTILHEFGHALGMIHEHQNSFNNQISWDHQKVYDWAKSTQGWDRSTTDVNILDMPTEEINGSEYDPFSIMLYFYPAELTTDDKGTNENVKLSPMDVFFLSKSYPGSKETPKEFYKNAYGEDINEKQMSLKTTYTSRNKKYDAYIISLIVVAIIFVLVMVFKK